MRKLLIILSLFLLTLQNNGQIRSGIIASQTVAGSSYSTEYQAVYNALDIKPGADTANVQNALVVAAKAHGWFAKADLIYIVAQRSVAGAKINWVNPVTFTLTTSVTPPTFAVYHGFTGVPASSTFLNTNWIPFTNGVQFTQNSAAISVYVTNSLNCECSLAGAQDGGSYAGITFLPRTSGTFSTRFNDYTSYDVTYAGGSGLYITNRTASDARTAYRNGTQIGTGSTTTSTGLTHGQKLYLLGTNNNGTLASSSSHQMTFAYVGASLSVQERADMQADVETYMDYLGIGVIP